MFETAAAPLGWAEIGGLQRRLLIRGAAASHPPRSPEFPFCTRWAFCLLGAFLFFHLLAKTEMSGLGPVPCADPLPAALSPVWKQWRGRGQLGGGGAPLWGGKWHLPMPSITLSPKASCPWAARYFPALAEPELQISPVSQQSEELRERPRKQEATPVGVLGSSQVGDALGERGCFPVAGSPRPRRARAALQLSVFAREPR